MTAKYSTFLLYTILLAAPLACAPICNADQFHSDSHGYGIELPHDWVEFPQDVLQEFVASIQKQNSTTPIHYDAGFQLDATGKWFEYPYVLVQSIALRRQLNEDEFPEFVRMMTGMDVGKILDEGLSSLGRQLMSSVDAGQPQLDVANRRFLWTMNSDVQGVGPIRTLIVGYFGRDSLVQVMFYSRRADWDRDADVRATIVDSFRFDPDKAYSVQIAASNPSPPSISMSSEYLDDVLSKAIAGFGAGILAVVFILMIRHHRHPWISIPIWTSLGCLVGVFVVGPLEEMTSMSRVAVYVVFAAIALGGFSTGCWRFLIRRRRIPTTQQMAEYESKWHQVSSELGQTEARVRAAPSRKERKRLERSEERIRLWKELGQLENLLTADGRDRPSEMRKKLEQRKSTTSG